MEFNCKICGREEDSERWISDVKKQVEENQICTHCLHWKTQQTLDDTERGNHNFAIVGGVHYTLHPASSGYFKGFGGRKFIFKFFDDESIVECENVWCQGTIPPGYWRDRMPDNAEIINVR